jgi:hypothetical protein
MEYHYSLTPGLNNDERVWPLSFPLWKGLEGNGNGDEYMPPEIVRRKWR